MNPLEGQSKVRLATAFVVGVLGKSGINISSFFILSSVVFHWPSDRSRLLWAALGLGVSILILLVSGSIIRSGQQWWRTFFWKLPFSIGIFGCLGVLCSVAHHWIKRQPHSVTGYEADWFFICVAGLIVCIFLRPRRPRGTNETG